MVSCKADDVGILGLKTTRLRSTLGYFGLPFTFFTDDPRKYGPQNHVRV